MESAGKPRSPGPSGFLVIPNGNSFDEYDYEVEGRIKPKSSPLPRRRGSDSSDDSEPEPPPNRRRKVSFADAFGLSLVSVKEFDHRDLSSPAAGLEALEGPAREGEEHFLSSLFAVPSSPEELLRKLRDQMCELECVELLPGTTSLRGVVRVLNLSFDKMVYVRTTLDGWASHFDLLAEFVPGSSDGETDRFVFKITLIPPFQRAGAKVEFCIRYEIPGRTFWANNNGMNYVLFCHKRSARDTNDHQQEDAKYKNKKSCLKTTSKDNSTERISIKLPGETADTPVQKQEVAVAMATPPPPPDGLRDDGGQGELVDSNRGYSWRSRRRAARLAWMQNPFFQNEGEGEDGGGSGREEEEESRRVEELLDMSTPPHWAATSNLPGIPNTNQTNGTEEAPNHDLVPPTSLKSDRNGRLSFAPDTFEKSDTASINRHEVDPALYPPEARTSTLGSWESWNTFVEFGDARAPSLTTAPEEQVPQRAAFDSSAYLEEDNTAWPEPSDDPPVECSNPDTPPVSESRESTSECARTDIPDRCDQEKEPENWLVTKDSWGSDQTPGKRDGEPETSSTAYHGLWTETAEVWQRFPFDSYLTPATQLESSNVGHKSASDDQLKRGTITPILKEPVNHQDADSGPMARLESWDTGLESVFADLIKTDTSTEKDKEPVNSEDKDPLNCLQPRQETGDPDSEATVDESIGHVAECDRHHQRKSGGDTFTGAADLAPSSEVTDTHAEVTDMAVTQLSLRPEPANGIAAAEFDNSSISSAMNARTDGPFSSHATFTLRVRGKGENVRDRAEEACKSRVDKEEDDSNEDVEGPYKVEKEAAVENDISFHENEEVITAEETKDDKDIFVERGDLSGDDTSAGNREGPSEEEMLMDYEEDLYDEEDVSMENGDDFYDEENDDFYGQEELSINKEEEEVSMRMKGFGLDQEDMPGETEEDMEVAQILGGTNKALEEGKEAPSMKMEESDKGKGMAFWEMEDYLQKKGNEEYTHCEKEMNVREGGKVFQEDFKDHGEVEGGLFREKERLVHDGVTGGALSTQSLPDKVMDSNTSCVDHAPPQGLKPQATPGNCRNMPTNDSTGPSVGSVRTRPGCLPSTNKPKFQREYGEAREVPGAPQADSDPGEEPVYRTTVHLPAVEKVENVARNYLLCWWDSSSHNVLRVFLYAFLCLVFLVTAVHYDFLVCFAFYLITVYWFCFHGESGIEQARG